MSDGLDFTQKDRALELCKELEQGLTKKTIDELDQLVADTQTLLPNPRSKSDGSIDRVLWAKLAEIVRTAEKLKHDIKQAVTTATTMRPSACVVIINDGRIAAIRSRKHGGALELPGGKAESDETPEQNAVRECQEEIGVCPVIVRLLVRDNCGGFDCSCFLGSRTRARLFSSSEGEAVWVTPDELLTGTYASHAAKWLPMVAKELAAR